MEKQLKKVYAEKIKLNISDVIYRAMESIGLLGQIDSSCRLCIKPNFTYPCYKPGVTTSPQVIEETVKILREFTKHISIIETDGGYGTFKAEEAFKGHNIYELCKKYNIEAVNLNKEPAENITIVTKSREKKYCCPRGFYMKQIYL